MFYKVAAIRAIDIHNACWKSFFGVTTLKQMNWRRNKPFGKELLRALILNVVQFSL
jgi:hypothetical protein